MKSLLIALLLLSSFNLMAQEKWKARRDLRVQFIGKRIEILNTAKSCMEKAAKREDFRNCKKAQKDSSTALKKEIKTKIDTLKAEHKKMKQEKKK